MTQPHPIIQKELDLFEEAYKTRFQSYGIRDLDEQILFLRTNLLAALTRASLAVVEERLKEIEKIDATKQDTFGHYYEKSVGEFMREVREILRSDTFATAKEIIGGK